MIKNPELLAKKIGQESSELIIDYIKKTKIIELSDILNTLDFVYYLREQFLADDTFVRVNIEKLTNIDF